ncbi:tetratricopeptide repeat protein [candidate division KSB1 bacterium]|nr:tetratricopeptide repeat protein [candidate division KSB1 bacterium]
MKGFIHYIILILIISCAGSYAQLDSVRYFQYIQDIDSRSEEKLADFLIQEIEAFQKMYPENQHIADTQFMLGKTYERKDEKFLAFAAYYKAIYQFPETAIQDSCLNRVRRLLQVSNLKVNKKDTLLQLYNFDFTTLQSPADKFYGYLSLLRLLNQKELEIWLQQEYQKFFIRHSEDERNAQILTWQADLIQKEACERKDNIFKSSKGQFIETEAAYYKVGFLYPDSPVRAYSELQRGLITSELDKQQKAIDILRDVVKKYPDTDHAVKALFAIADIQENKIKNPQQAIYDYLQVVTSYPASIEAVHALEAIAEIKRKSKDYTGAIAVYEELIQKYPENTASRKALSKITEIYQKNVKDNEKAVETLTQFYKLYPQDPQTPERLLEAATLCEKKLKDTQKAQLFYTIINRNYPEHPANKTASSKIDTVQVDEQALEQLLESHESAPADTSKLKNMPPDSSATPPGSLNDDSNFFETSEIIRPATVLFSKDGDSNPSPAVMTTNANDWDIQSLDTGRQASFLSRLEKDVILEINLMRSNPPRYAERYLTAFKKMFKGKKIIAPGQTPLITYEGTRAVDECIQVLKKTPPLPIFTPAEGLTRAARDHAKDQARSGRTGHDGADGSTVTDRIERYGQWSGLCGENISYGYNNARRIVIQLLVDDGVPSRGHRESFLNPQFSLIGAACGKHAKFKYMCVLDMASFYNDHSR